MSLGQQKCNHLSQMASLQPPKLSQSVHREECTQCFDDQDTASGISVCLTCFNGGCLSSERHHALTHWKKTGHLFSLDVKRVRKETNERFSGHRAEGAEPPLKMTKLAIVEERDEDKYSYVTSIRCWDCDISIGEDDSTKIPSLISSVLTSPSSARQSEVKAWEEEILACEHTLTLDQIPLSAQPIAQAGDATCSSCDIKANLWLCLTCGSLGCGRAQFGVVNGGNSHGLAHYKATGHPVAVKLGTITPEGNADIYCYSCDDSKLDPYLSTHLSTFGINLSAQTKTELSTTEMQIEHNLKYDFSLTNEDGKALEPIHGKGLTGLRNLGNSCYMASVLQAIFALPDFRDRYYDLQSANEQNHAETCPEPLPADCVECQMRKIADGLLSGRYAVPSDSHTNASSGAEPADPPTPIFQQGLKPSTFKSLIGKGHPEFATMKQQDSEEFLGYLVTVLRRDWKKWGGEDPTRIFSYTTSQRLQCTKCQKVRYRTDESDVLSVAVPAIEKGKDPQTNHTLYQDVLLTQCVDSLLSPEPLEDYQCPSCKVPVTAVKQTFLSSFPSVLVVHAKKFQLVNWVPTKLDIPVRLPEGDVLEFTDRHFGKGLQPGEEELPEDQSGAQEGSPPQFNETTLAQLQAMGFPLIRCQKALLATGNTDNAEAAMEWLFGHMDDPDIDAPIQPTMNAASSGPEPSMEQINVLSDMGFTSAQAKKALRETGNNMERAVEWLFSHPDDAGDVDTGSAETAQHAQPKTLPGSTELPARYRLKAFISHKGPSVHSGHYVAHIRIPVPTSSSDDKMDTSIKVDPKDQWVLFNDEKVVKADEESVNVLKQLAYLYILERV
ncbi:ubiquitin carboxyl-terminal hydrolase 14 [Lentinula raphanica]|uniref:Ubiquitin carboxyl-terminal hydrolase n=1 Tax=Lentinula raphanica TaxID=153919 RepID=A0AA38NX93_9AGAR|nr:ubiquitin carboxyl-terminal hydrolase 14 [Lentinula raphanica]KAJ3967770.1 ubiquitin carboxyl-terminal hydrolase 14 [Lentinula raphanica]